MRMIIQSRLIVFLDYECGQQLQEHQKCCRQSGRNDRMSIKGIYDIHCHIVPGVDDGATDIGETVIFFVWLVALQRGCLSSGNRELL